MPLLSPDNEHVDELDAARVCHADWMHTWTRIRRLARQLRALCEHPVFAEFEGDGIDAATIAANARELAKVVEHGDTNIVRLFDELSASEAARIDGVQFQVDGTTGLLVPAHELQNARGSGRNGAGKRGGGRTP